MSDERKDLDRRRLHVVAREGSSNAYSAVFLSLQKYLKEDHYNSIADVFVYEIAVGGGQGALVTCAEELQDFDLLKKGLIKKAGITRASKNLALISLKGSPDLEDIPLYFESPTYCGVEDNDVIGYKEIESETIVLIVTKDLETLLKHDHKDKNKKPFKVVRCKRKSEPFKAEPFQPVSKHASSASDQLSDEDTTDRDNKRPEETQSSGKYSKQNSAEDTNRGGVNTGAGKEDTDSEDENRHVAGGAGNKQGEVIECRPRMHRGGDEFSEENQHGDIDQRRGGSSYREGEEDMDTDEREAAFNREKAIKRKEQERRERNSSSESPLRDRTPESDNDRRDIKDDEWVVVGCKNKNSNQDNKGERNFNYGYNADHFGSPNSSELAQVHNTRSGRGGSVAGFQQGRGGKSGTKDGGVTGFGKSSDYKKEVEVKMPVDSEVRLELISYFLRTRQLGNFTEKFKYKTDSVKKLLIISGIQAAVKELVDALTLTLQRDPFYKSPVDVKLNFESQLMSQRGKEWFDKFTTEQELVPAGEFRVSPKVTLYEEKKDRNGRLWVASYDELDATKWARELGTHLMCAKIPYDHDIKSGDSRWKSRIKDWKKKGLITIGDDKVKRNVEVYGVPADVIALMDDVDAFVYEREREMSSSWKHNIFGTKV